MDWGLSMATVLANFFLGRKNVVGWIILEAVSILWIYYAIWILNPPQYGLLLSCVPYIFISGYNCYKWTKEKNESRKL